jgi:hypothetical protein
MRVADDFAAHPSSSLSKVLNSVLSLRYSRSRAFILQRLSLMTRIAIGEGLPMESEENGNKYNYGYYLADGIYPKR